MNLLQKRKKIIILIFIFILLSIPSVSYALEEIEKVNHQLPNNIYVDNLNIGGKTAEQAGKIIEQRINQLEDKMIEIVLNNEGQVEKYKFALKDLGYYSDENKIKSDVVSILYNDLGLIDRLKRYRDIERNGKNFKISHGIEFSKFANAIKKLDVSKMSKPVNARYMYENGNISIEGGSPGYEIDVKGFYDKILEGIRTDQYEFNVNLKEVKPQVTIESLASQGIKEKIAFFTTKFSVSNKPRTSNIRLAASNINGTILAPGDVFSFNKVVGERTIKRGFYKAGVYVNGKIDEDVGGGICQVSTTLYNAVLLSDLEVMERSNHSLTVPYVPLSRDAAVSWGTKDFKFRNNTEKYIYIHSQSTGNTISFELFGTKNHNRRVELISTVLKHTASPIEYIEDELLELGEESIVEKGHDGYKSKLIKRVYEDEKLIKEQVLSNDRYLTSPKIIKKGVKQVEDTKI
jgi:vancomycin resistance protein YoaR